MERSWSEETAVSPVIGVVLLVAITIVLATVVGGYIFIFDGDEPAPSASFSFEYDNTSEGFGEGTLTITHDGGEAVEAQRLVIQGPGVGAMSWDSIPRGDPVGQPPDPEDTYGAESMISSGHSITLYDVHQEYEVFVVWADSLNESSAVLGEDSGPEY